MQPPQAQPEPRARIVLLGASNAAVGIREAVDALRARYGAPLEVVCALGHGRSYGMPSSFLVRRLPGIVGSGLWDALAAAPPRETHVLVTDVGNDLAFGVEPAAILGWLETALARLTPGAASLALTALPLDNLRRLGALEFELWRRLLFPLHGTPRRVLLERAELLDARLRELARARGHRLVDLQAAWYGADPIHIRRARRSEAWTCIVGEPSAAPRGSLPRAPAWWRLVPERRWVLGLPGGRPQPSVRLADGTTLALH